MKTKPSAVRVKEFKQHGGRRKMPNKYELMNRGFFKFNILPPSAGKAFDINPLITIKAKFSRRNLTPLLSSEHVKIMNNFVEEQAVAEARLKEIDAIYRSLISIAEGQKKITIEMPNGKWRFESNEI